MIDPAANVTIAGRVGSARTNSASQFSCLILSNACSRSPGVGAIYSNDLKVQSFCGGLHQLVLPRVGGIGGHYADGRIAWRSSTDLPMASPNILAIPVMLPPGWAKLLMKPKPI